MKEFRSITELINAFPTEQSCIDYLASIRWEGNVISPFDPNSKVYQCKDNRYKCKNTGKYFNVRTGTIFEVSKICLRDWFMAIYLYVSHKRGISSYQLSEQLGITQKSAWFILQRLRFATSHLSFERVFEGIVECDETFVGGKNKNRHWDKKVKNSQGRSFKDKVPVFGMLERKTKQVKTFVVADTQAKTIQPLVYFHTQQGSYLMTDEWLAYQGLGKDFTHRFTDHRKKQYALGEVSSNGIECFWSHLKRLGITPNIKKLAISLRVFLAA